ncbi:hypothetical protein NLU13_3141 [Sarocladium strictum]|uniref:Uncharacterized protein n=1 Tax=Sarocladium strictum TaxID=5046 RepID=A0AA39L9G2_SARSR|nr:hypothetical protein NLU13_3141 [Sarocladium strictum]
MLNTTSTSPQGTTVEVPKNNGPNRIASPPPAYAPPSTTTSSSINNASLTLPQLTALRIQRAGSEAAYRNSTCTSSNHMHQPLAATLMSGHADEMDTCEGDEFRDGEDAQSPICLRINTSVNITQSNNIVCLSDTPPAEHATAIANAVVKAMQENSSGNCGIPMIDEDGRPRPIKIEVDASMLVEGSGNVVGSQPIINEFLRQRGLRRSRQTSLDGEELDYASPLKRRRTSFDK